MNKFRVGDIVIYIKDNISQSIEEVIFAGIDGYYKNKVIFAIHEDYEDCIGELIPANERNLKLANFAKTRLWKVLNE